MLTKAAFILFKNKLIYLLTSLPKMNFQQHYSRNHTKLLSMLKTVVA